MLAVSNTRDDKALFRSNFRRQDAFGYYHLAAGGNPGKSQKRMQR